MNRATTAGVPADLGTHQVIAAMRANESWRNVIDVIEAEARADERQRIRKAIISHPQLGEWADVSDALSAIADLLDGAS